MLCLDILCLEAFMQPAESHWSIDDEDDEKTVHWAMGLWRAMGAIGRRRIVLAYIFSFHVMGSVFM